MNPLIFDGKVISGKGSGKKYLALPWVKSQIEEKLGFTPYLGTLNLQLSPESANRKKRLNEAEDVEICPAEGYCLGVVYKAYLNEVECAVVVPKVEGYPKDILEVIAPIYLRGVLGLKDGDPATVTVPV